MTEGPNYDFGALMGEKYPDHSWEPLTVYARPDPLFNRPDSTDRYELTTYKIWNSQTVDPSKGWVFF